MGLCGYGADLIRRISCCKSLAMKETEIYLCFCHTLSIHRTCATHRKSRQRTKEGFSGRLGSDLVVEKRRSSFRHCSSPLRASPPIIVHRPQISNLEFQIWGCWSDLVVLFATKNREGLLWEGARSNVPNPSEFVATDRSTRMICCCRFWGRTERDRWIAITATRERCSEPRHRVVIVRLRCLL